MSAMKTKRSITDLHVEVVGNLLNMQPMSAFMRKCIRRWLEEEDGHIGRAVDRAKRVMKL